MQNKKELTEALNEYLRPMRERRAKISDADIENILHRGAAEAREFASRQWAWSAPRWASASDPLLVYHGMVVPTKMGRGSRSHHKLVLYSSCMGAPFDIPGYPEAPKPSDFGLEAAALRGRRRPEWISRIGFPLAAVLAGTIYLVLVGWAMFRLGSPWVLALYGLPALWWIGDRIATHLASQKSRRDASARVIADFEEAFCSYFEKVLDDLKNRRLYRKLAIGEEFTQALLAYEALLARLVAVNRLLSWPLPYLERHLVFARMKAVEFAREGRDSDVASTVPAARAADAVSDAVPITSKAEGMARPAPDTGPKATSIPPGPEVRYGVPRLIDWEAMGAVRRRTGLAGELIAVNVERRYLLEVGRQDLSEQVRHVSAEVGDGLGYDVLSYFPDGRAKYIEVKSTSGTDVDTFFLSLRERAFLEEHRDDSFVYRVSQVTHDPSQAELHVLTAREVLDSEIAPVTFKVVFAHG